MQPQPPDLAAKPEVRALTKTVDELVEYAVGYKVATVQEYEAGAEDLKRVKSAQKNLEDMRTAITKPMNAALKAVNDFFRKPAQRLSDVEDAIKGSLAKFAQAQERLRQEEQSRADEAARKEQERINAQATRALEKGQAGKAERLADRAAAVVAPVIQRETPKVAGVQLRDFWQYEITDPNAVPREYLMADTQKIGRVVTALKGDTQIAGVRVWCEKRVAAATA